MLSMAVQISDKDGNSSSKFITLQIIPIFRTSGYTDFENCCLDYPFAIKLVHQNRDIVFYQLPSNR